MQVLKKKISQARFLVMHLIDKDKIYRLVRAEGEPRLSTYREAGPLLSNGYSRLQ